MGLADEIYSYYGCAADQNELMHYGIKRRSGRYPWGSGDNPYQRSGDWISRVNELKKSGMNEKEVCDAMMIDSVKELRLLIRIANNERKMDRVATVQSMMDHGKSVSEIARDMGVNESSVRSWLNEDSRKRTEAPTKTAEILKEELKNKKMLDVGLQVESELGVSRDTLDTAIRMLEAEGYQRFGVGVAQATNNKLRTTVEVLAQPDIDQKYAYNHIGEIDSVADYHSTDGGIRWDKREHPASIDSSRVAIKYGDEGGEDMDGVILLRPGVADLNLGNSHYAQVRIMVDNSHYLKGMAMYSDDIPEGKDILFNTNKKSGTPMEKVLKPIKDDPDNPFGALIKAGGQSHYIGEDGKEHLSVINKLKEEGDYEKQAKSLSSQFLSKQPLELINRQLNETYQRHKDEFDEINALTNPTIKRKLLNDFADSCDGAAIHMKAASLPRQTTQVILPLPKIKETEVYAPNYENGEKLALIRFPHAGTFEIPVLTVNNNDPQGKKLLGPSVTDAIGINPKTAKQLSGADFDGDTVVAIPTGKNGVNIQHRKYLKELEDFDPNIYTIPEGSSVKPMSKKYQQQQMGVVSNLITDMTEGGAPEAEVAKAVKHSMVVIDAVKHNYDYRQSAQDNDIAALKKKWQRWVDSDGNVHYGGASTVVSRHKQTIDVPERKGSGIIDPETGKVSYKESGRLIWDKEAGDYRRDKDGNPVKATSKASLILSVDDVHKLSSGHPKDEAYAEYANQMKALANQARKTMVNTPRLTYDPSAAKTYADEVNSLNAKLSKAQLNIPKERRAQAIANSIINAKKEAYPELNDKDNKKELDKVKQLAINDARARVGASSKNVRIEITDKEWKAIQSGAVSDSKLNQILRFSDADKVRQLAMPKTTATLPTAKVSRIQQMSARGATNAQIAEALGVSTSTVSKYLNGGES